MPDKKLPQDDPAQSQRFIDMAKKVEAESTPEAFARTVVAVSAGSPTAKADKLELEVLQK